MSASLTLRCVQLCSIEDEVQDVIRHAIQGWLAIL